MRKAIFLMCLPSLTFAVGPKYNYPSVPGLDDEMQNIYHSVSYPVINYGTCSSCTITSLTASTLTVTTRATVPNGVNSTDAVAYGQIFGQAPVQVISNGPGFSTSNIAFQSTGLSASITPSSTTSRVRIAVTGVIGGSVAGALAEVSLSRGSTDLSQSGGGFCQLTVPANTSNRVPCSINFIDSPSTNTATTYTVKLRGDGVNSVIFTPATDAGIIVEEIGSFASGGGGGGGGHIIQVVQTSTTVNFQTTSTSFVASNLSLSITLSSTTSKVLILVSTAMQAETQNKLAHAAIFRGAAKNILTTSTLGAGIQFASTGGNTVGNLGLSLLDAPLLNGPTTYTLMLKTDSAGTADFGTGDLQSMTLMEIQ